MYWLRRWSVRHARALELTYQWVERGLLSIAPIANRIDHSRLEKPVAAVEKLVKGALFDCQMCGQCVLSNTGMSCPMNCPKSIRNGPCGGVREGGFCEVKPEMRCVWVEGWQGAARMQQGAQIATVQFAVDHRLKGRSSWLRVMREKSTPPVTPEKSQAVIETSQLLRRRGSTDVDDQDGDRSS
ncbi:methylenetetrahydrofolate reductase C-terminal domain-containing protein [Granulosicoccus sp. 3-233]|uniref:methylenetetrahydrofolate reductase C-terminal domain-containing protein n=1 Tax=Granulosicoccus sp. 3-233 TaxID=3417969 RepID=UPI003D347C16